MKTVKVTMLVTFAALLLTACGKTETGEKAANSSNNNATPNANSSSTISAPAQPAPSVPPPPVEDRKEKAKEPAAAKPASSINAAALFVAQKCTGCHGADGKGKLKGSPNFADAEWHKKHNDAELTAAIKIGKKPMPAYEGKLSEGEIKALVAYVRSFAK